MASHWNVGLLLLAVVAAAAPAQCSPAWTAGTGTGSVLVPLSDGDVVGGGYAYIARYDGAGWQPLGSGVAGGAVVDVAQLANGDLVAVGSFTSAGGAPAPGIARWDGVAWSALPAPSPAGIVLHVAAGLPNGDLVVAGIHTPNPQTYTTYVLRWDGATWQPIGTAAGTTGSTPFATPFDLDVLPTGDLVALGDWQAMQPMGTVAVYNELVRWDGALWHRLGDVPNPRCLLATRDGDVYVGHELGVSRWHAGAFGPVGNGPIAGGIGVATLAELPDGSVVAGGLLTYNPTPPIGLQRWAAGAWSSLGFGTNGVAIADVAFHRAGQLLVQGNFAAAGGVAAPGSAALVAPCAATVQATPTACVGPAGPIALTAVASPWTGATFRSEASGFAANALALSAFGLFAQQQPLSALHPAGLPGCDLSTSVDAVLLAVPNNGVVATGFAIPPAAALAGVTLRHQVLQGVFGVQGSLLSLSSSNLLTLVVGTF